MRTDSEAILEDKLIQQLVGLNYESVQLRSEQDIVSNLKSQLERFNKTTFSSLEFDNILNYLAKGNVFDKAEKLRGPYAITRENGDHFWVEFFNSERSTEHIYQVTNQVTQFGQYENRYDVTLLVNGLPLVQIELKKSGIELKEAFKQINRYIRHSYSANHSLFQYVQIFVISNSVNTKYFANNALQALNFKQTFAWADTNNKSISELPAFTDAFLNIEHLNSMLSNYIVLNETYKVLMILRPYQFYAAEAIVKQAKESKDNGYIWHTTGSGKTLTSFKASQIMMSLPEVHKVVFVVDRKDLDYQTMEEFNNFKPNSVDVTSNTKTLVNRFADNTKDTKIILTTIQKLNNAIVPGRYQSNMEHLKDKRIVFVFDECHRSQFGDTHRRITEFFQNSQLFGFTGTPIFADNASKNDLGKRTTKDLFGNCLHKYVINDAIRDQNVLKFSIEYIGRYKQKGNTFIDIDVEDIDKKEVLDSPKRIEKIVDWIIENHDSKTANRSFSAMLAVSGIPSLIKYYDFFKKKKEEGLHDLRIATIFSYGANEDDVDAMGLLPAEMGIAAEPQAEYQSSHSREKLDEYIADYNKMFGTKNSTKDGQEFEKYAINISKRLKERERVDFKDEDRLDIIIVVNMMLTGFDAKKVNTMYVDKNLRQHGLIQAFSRTNRILNENKSQGNIVCFRNLKQATDEAIALFSNKNAKEEIFLPPYSAIAKKCSEAFANLIQIAPTYQSVDELPSEDEEAAFIKAFREVMRYRNVLQSHADFDWEDLDMDEQTFDNYKSKYLDLYEKVQSGQAKEKTSILEEIDFELELIHRDDVNVAYILKLLAQMTQAQPKDIAAQKKAIMNMLAGEITLRSKRELIEKFIDEHLPKITVIDTIPDEFAQYMSDQKVLALHQICEEEDLEEDHFKSLLEAYVYSGQVPQIEDVIKCLHSDPILFERLAIGERIIERMKKYAEVFVEGMMG